MSDPPMRHLIAINCHRYHDAAVVQPGLLDVSRAAAVLQARWPEDEVETRLFWHNPAPLPRALSAEAARVGIVVSRAPHVSNGDNLNRQIAYARDAGFDLFYRVDADDTVAPTRLAHQADRLRTGACDLCGAGLCYETQDTRAFTVHPPAKPGLRDYLENRFVLHPTMAFRMRAFTEAGLHYWHRRLEDKALLADAVRAGLRIENVPICAGSYRLKRSTRSGFAPAWLNVQLNICAAWSARAFGLLIYAAVLFCAQMLFGPHLLRRIRSWLYPFERKRTSRATAPQKWRSQE